MVTEPTATGFITAYAAGTMAPDVANVTFSPGQTVSTLVTARVGPSGAVSLRNGAPGSVQLVADVVGYYLSGDPTAPGMFVPANPPARIRDTRDGTGGPVGPLATGASVSLVVAGRGGVPATGAAAAVLTISVLAPGAAGWLTVFDAGPGPAILSTVGFGAGQTASNLVSIKLGPGGIVTITNQSAGAVHYVADVAGYFRV